MTSFSKKNAAFAILIGLLLLLGTSEAQSNQDCCLSYNKKPLRRSTVVGFTEQFSSEVCDINAVIFHTRKGYKACANPKDHWVKDRVRWLSEKLKKMA
ncbi:C-C motif chemokine 20 [Elgaria multicarinata webbii]|uniref:C-C motif chemokine 20 n=1 Tax=Elgaria multicarinata webbii TaxID=159646 RepID=UPI002FCD31D8